MAYNAVSQAELEVASNATDSDDSRPSSPHRNHRENSFHQLPLDADHMGGSAYLEPAKSADESGMGRLGSMIRSMTSTSYDMVEADDYDVADHPSTARRSQSPRRMPLPLDTTTAPSSPPDSPRLRSPITDEPVPLSHPTPDLQSLQGAYLNNVERLERSAERISSADIGTEIRKIDRQQKRRSVSSLPSPVGPATNEAAYGIAHVPSPHNSIMSASRLAQVSEHHPDEPHNPPIAHPQIDPIPPPQQMPAPTQLDAPYHDEYHNVMEDELPRPASAASGDTFQQARVLFNDFDGVHYVHHDQGSLGRQVSLSRPPLASRPDHYKEPQAGENMVYYPAPVPMMLNLPPKLSQKSNTEREKRRTQILDSVQAENRKSAPWLPGQVAGDDEDPERAKQRKDLPPQLRASAFFEHPAAPIDIEVKQASAVATLDSILDASTHAPVTAFTDHPYAGHLGPEVYGRSKAKPSAKKHDSLRTVSLDHRDGSSHRLDDPTEAEAADIHEGTSLHDSRRDAGSDGVPRGDEDVEEEEELAFTGPPTTLLAELELRKHELSQRQRTAATSVGLHSTLLQLDAVAQKQSEHRRKRPVTLAWENPDAHKNEDDADEDVPLGVLFPEKNAAAEEVRPLGLMEKREMEECEPLSRRRARLRGEAPPPPRTPDKRPTTMYSRYMPEPEPEPEPQQPDSGDEEETLAQRMKRMKAKDRTSTVAESEFATEILAELGHLQGDDEKEKEADAAPEEETLAQRRARLQKESIEAKRNSTAKIPRYRRSMADILHARRPSTAAHQTLRNSESPVQAPVPRGLVHSQSYDARLSMHQLPVQPGQPAGMGIPLYPGHIRNDSAGYGMAHPNTFYSDAILGMNHLSYAAPPGYHAKTMRPGVEGPQREIIDRWRQSIV